MSFFSPESSNSGSQPMELIPAGTLVKAFLAVRDIKRGQNSGARYLDIELAVQGGEFDNRRIFTVVCDPWDEATSDKAREMAVGSITRLMEQVGIFKPESPETYALLDSSDIQDVALKLQGKTVGFVVGVQKGKDGYADKNSVRDWASPNPQSNGFKIYEAIISGATTLTPAKSAGVFGQAAAPQAARPAQPATAATSTPAWLKK
jgi:hypothetical protein